MFIDRINIQTQQGKIEIFDNYYLLTSASIHIKHLTTVCINALDNKYLNKRFDNFASMTKTLYWFRTNTVVIITREYNIVGWKNKLRLPFSKIV